MIAVDTNILVYAHRREMPLHQQALAAMEKLMQNSPAWGVAWPCLHEFIAVVTNPRIFKTPTPLTVAFECARSWEQGGNLYFFSEGPDYLGLLESVAKPAAIQGSKIHDARIAALCLHHGVDELWSCDRDFSLFPRLKVKNPLVESL